MKANVERVAFAAHPDGRWDYRITFTDSTGTQYRLAVTDLAFRCYLDHTRTQQNIPPDNAAKDLTELFQSATVYLRIGLARGWEKYPDRCHLQITGVYSYPDYLEGKCFADFKPRDKSAVTDIEVPF